MVVLATAPAMAPATKEMNTCWVCEVACNMFRLHTYHSLDMKQMQTNPKIAAALYWILVPKIDKNNLLDKIKNRHSILELC